MKDRALRCSFGLKHAQDVAVRVAVVNDQRLADLFGDLDVLAKRRLLDVRRHTSPVVVKTCLANRAHLRKRGERRELFDVDVGEVRCLIGMHRDGREHVGKRGRNLSTPT